jgi:glucosamine--fructose-6-phosphate aminotransferase (isomerizing)
MCGIVGAVSTRNVAKDLIEGLKRLEYRGYDSAGLAVLDNKGVLQRLRRLGKVAELQDEERKTPFEGVCGIAHTRWATHGCPSETNAHPHTSCDEMALVHNGIIENHATLRDELKERGYQVVSETDTEVAVHLIHSHFAETKNMMAALQAARLEMKGALAIGLIHESQPDVLYAMREGSPLVIGLGEGENFIGSDPLALGHVSKKVLYLSDGDIARITKDKVEVFDREGKPATREIEPINVFASGTDKGEFRHFMLKEIFEQPRVMAETLQGRLTEEGVFPETFGESAPHLFEQVRHIHIVACGTSYHAGLVARYWLEKLSGIPTTVETASEYRYRKVVVPDNTLFITVSQSGETADTLAALRKAHTLPYLSTLGICNVPSSTLVRESDLVCLTRAGVEIGVASTKAFTTQLCVFLLLTMSLMKHEGKEKTIAKALLHMPVLSEKILQLEDEIKVIAEDFVEKNHALFLGRGVQYPVALEGALKLKEISYIHAEAYPAGELKHGPLALVDSEMPVIAVAPNDKLLEKLKSNLEEVKARGGELYVFADNAAKLKGEAGIHVVELPFVETTISPIVYTLPLQLLAYHVAVLKGTDVDQPRNLAKSVTVE